MKPHKPNTRSSPLIAYDFLIHNALAADRLLFYPPRDPRDAPPLDWYHHVFGTALLQEVGLAGWDAAVAYYMGLEAEVRAERASPGGPDGALLTFSSISGTL